MLRGLGFCIETNFKWVFVDIEDCFDAPEPHIWVSGTTHPTCLELSNNYFVISIFVHPRQVVPTTTLHMVRLTAMQHGRIMATLVRQWRSTTVGIARDAVVQAMRVSVGQGDSPFILC